MPTEDDLDEHIWRTKNAFKEHECFMNMQFKLMQDSQKRLEDLATFAENVEILLPTLQIKIVSLIEMIEDLEIEVRNMEKIRIEVSGENNQVVNGNHNTQTHGEENIFVRIYKAIKSFFRQH